jgi:hypothetical protein
MPKVESNTLLNGKSSGISSLMFCGIERLHRYGLAAAFSEIERLSHQVTSAGNPITMDLRTRYVVKGIGMEKTITSVVKIYHEGDKITKVEDRWNDQLPGGAFKNVSIFSPFSWLHYTESWLWWMWSFVWWTRGWKVRRSSHFCRLDYERQDDVC